MKKTKALGDDPFFDVPEKKKTEDSSDIVSTEKIEAIKKTLSDMKHEVKKLEQRKKNREDDYQRMTFIIKKDILARLRDYCFTERISQKEALEKILVEFLEDKGDLLSHPEKPKQVRRKK